MEAAFMLEFRLRILDVRERETDPFSYLGIVEGFPGILVHSVTMDGTEAALVHALESYLNRLCRPDETRIEFDEFPVVRLTRVHLGPAES